MDDRQPHAAVSHSRGGRTNAHADRRNGRGRGVSGGGGGLKGLGRTGAGATERAARSVAGAPASAPPKPPRGNNIPAACVVRRQPVMMTGIRPGAGSAARTAPVGAFSLAPARRTVARRANSRPRIGPRRASRPPHAARGLRSRGTRAGGGGLPPPRRGGGAVGGAEALGAFERAPGPRRLPSSLRRRRIAPRPAPRRDAGRLRLGRGLPPLRPGPDDRLASRRDARRRRPEDPPRARSGARDGALPPPPRRTRRRRRRRPRHPATVPRRGGGLRRRLLSRGGARRILRRLLRRHARRRVDARRSPRSPRGASCAEARGARPERRRVEGHPPVPPPREGRGRLSFRRRREKNASRSFRDSARSLGRWPRRASSASRRLPPRPEGRRARVRTLPNASERENERESEREGGGVRVRVRVAFAAAGSDVAASGPPRRLPRGTGQTHGRVLGA